MGFWDINYNAKAWQQLPVRLRQVVQYVWVKCLLRPVVVLHGLFADNREANLYELAHNGQVCHLEGVLNDAFDNTLRRIYIEDPEYYDPIYVYQHTEDKPVYVAKNSELPVSGYAAPVYAFLSSEVYSGSGLQFKVRVPAAISLTTETLGRMRALINRYRLVSKSNYTITNF